MALTVAQPLIDLPLPHPPHALVGLLGSGKSDALRAHYARLLREGRRAERVLVWVANAAQANVWKAFVRGFEFAHGETQVFTFRSWVRRELLMNWPLVESGGLLPGPPRRAEPLLVSLTASQQLLRDLIEPIAEKYPALERCYTVPPHRLIQVLDTYARLVEHGLSPESAASLLDAGHWLGPDSPELHAFVGEAIASYRRYCFEHRVLDFSAQLELFSRALWANPAYRERLTRELDALIVDNLEETFPVAQDVVAALAPGLESLLVARDLNGGLREYLGGDPAGADRLLEGFHVTLADAPTLAPAPLGALGAALAAFVLASPEEAPPPGVPQAPATVHTPRTLRVQMFESVGKRLRELLDAGVPQGEIVVIAPVVDPLLSWHLRQGLAERGKALRVLAGSNRVIDHRAVRILITLARLARPAWNAPPAEADVAEALETLLSLHPLEAPHMERLVYAKAEGALRPAEAVEWPKHLAGRREAYAAVAEWVAAARGRDVPLDRLFEEAFASLYAPRQLRALAPDAEVSGAPVPQPYRWRADEALDILQLDQLISGARSYRQLASVIDVPEPEIAKRFLRSIYAGELAERPLIPRGELPEAVTLYTAAKYAEEGRPARYQLWVDASAPQWKKSDLRELMNPRVLSRHWGAGAYTDEHDQRHQAEKLARTLHTLTLKCTERLEVFSSDYGSDGSELGGELAYWLSELVSDRARAASKATSGGTGA